jgi:Icc-related predicted phosphoesterase
MTGIYVIYPERKVMGVTELMSLAKQAFNDGLIDNTAEDPEDAIYLLEDAGLITMKIHLVSDLHLEFAPYNEGYPAGTDVIIAAGDISTGCRAPFALREIYGEDIPIVYIAGNHEHYGHEIHRNRFDIMNEAEQFNIHFLDDNFIEIDGVIFLGGTLWTNYLLHGEQNKFPSMNAASMDMNDFRRIKVKKDETYRDLIPDDTLTMHKKSLSYFERILEYANAMNKPTVVVSHMAPHSKSIHRRFEGDRVNPYYASDLEKFIDKHNPTLWVHGHMHDSFDYKVFETRVVCNPRGYGTRTYDKTGKLVIENENVAFNPKLLLDI